MQDDELLVSNSPGRDALLLSMSRNSVEFTANFGQSFLVENHEDENSNKRQMQGNFTQALKSTTKKMTIAERRHIKRVQKD